MGLNYSVWRFPYIPTQRRRWFHGFNIQVLNFSNGHIGPSTGYCQSSSSTISSHFHSYLLPRQHKVQGFIFTPPTDSEHMKGATFGLDNSNASGTNMDSLIASKKKPFNICKGGGWYIVDCVYPLP